MGNCCERCLGRLDKRRYLRTRYNVERDISIEFENLMDEETQEHEMPKGQLELNRPFTVSSYMRWLVHQEEELRREEEAYYEAKREAARVARATKHRDASLVGATSKAVGGEGAMGGVTAGASKKDPNTWLGDEDSDWEMAGGEEDFDVFLECVRARSLAVKTQLNDARDGASETSSKDDRSKTEASSIDLEWEHEAGMQPAPKDRQQRYAAEAAASSSSSHIAELAITPLYLQQNDRRGGGGGAENRGVAGGKGGSRAGGGTASAAAAIISESLSGDEFEWDNDYVSSPNEVESRTLLAKYHHFSSDR